MGRPLVRNASNASWIDTFCKGGWKMLTPDYGYITLNPQNFKIRNADNTGWLNFTCPMPIPTEVKRGKVVANRIVDSAGYLWCAGHAVGIYDNNSTRSSTWRKVKTNASGVLINGIQKIEGGGGFNDMYPTLYMFMFDGRILFSGYGSDGNAGDGTAMSPSAEYQYGRNRIKDVTVKWSEALGNTSGIASFDRGGALVTNEGRPFVLGYCEYEYNAGTQTNLRRLGYSGIQFSSFWAESGTRVWFSHTWKRPKLFTGGNASDITVSKIVRTGQNHTFALATSGQLLQCPLWQAQALSYESLPTVPTGSDVKNLHPLEIPFTAGTIKTLHRGGVIETTAGELFYYQQKKVTGLFYGFDWINTGINLSAFGSPVAKLGFDWKLTAGVYYPALFLLLEDGRLYASGDNTDGWFGIGAATSVPIGAPTLINNNVYDFDVDLGNCTLTKWDDSIWGTGLNQYGRLGVGDTVKTRTWRQGIIENA